jgi:DNA modification methylase
MIQNDLQNLAHPITELQLLPGNPRRGDIEAVKRSLEAFGQRKPIVVRRSDSVVIAGNHTLQAAQALGWDEIAVVWVDDDEVTSKAFALADNRTAELGDYDEEALADLINDVGSLNPGLLESSGWDDKAVKELLDRVEQIELPTDVDEVPEDVPAVSKLGDVWLLGNHRVMCGDSLVVANLDLLMNGKKAGCVLTDPPYGIDLNTDYSQSETNKGKKYKKVLNDDKPFDASMIYNYFDAVAEQYWWGADYYRRTIADSELTGSWLVWDKRVDEHLDSVIGSAFELCWSRTRHQRKILRYQWTNYTSHENAGHKRAHPTEKPVAMLIQIIDDYAPKNCVVVDLFGGSGSTMIAAEETKRFAYLMELDPHYVDVICARYQKHTGVLPVLESSGKVHDFLNV